MNNEKQRRNIIILLSQIKEHTNKIELIIKEVKNLTKQMNIPSLNLDSYIEQLNSINNSMRNSLLEYNKKYILRSNFQNVKEVPIDKELKIHIGFKRLSGVVHTFEAQYGTTIDKLLSTYIKKVAVETTQNDLQFEYNGIILNLGDETRIENIFSGVKDPTIIVHEKNLNPSFLMTSNNNQSNNALQNSMSNNVL